MNEINYHNFSQEHIPVMTIEALNFLNTSSNGIYIDGTLGAGGHALKVLANLSTGRLIGIDRDLSALKISNKRLAAHKKIFSSHHISYHDLPQLFKKENISTVEGVLLDLGLSSMQLNSNTRGFAFESNGELDMRFDQTHGKAAHELISVISESDLADIIYIFGEERYSRKIASSIKSMDTLKTAADLKEAVCRSTPPHKRKKTLARVFQALRIEVNDELKKLQIFLDIFCDYLSIKGKIVIISYHSLEDRMVKHAFKKLKINGQINILTKKPVIPSANEQLSNSRSRSAKLRAAEKIG